MPRTKPDDPNLVAIKKRRHTTCWYCHTELWKERTFTDRLTPLKRLPDGRKYSREDLEAELEAQATAWQNSPVAMVHPKCEHPAVEQLLQTIDVMDQRLDRLQEIETTLIEHSTDPAVQQLLDKLGLSIQTATV